MTIKLCDLPYDKTALAPHISAETLDFHHGKHHQTYVDKTNGMIDGGPLASASVEEIIREASASGNKPLFNNSAQIWNHGFYWQSLAPEQTKPDAKLAAAIDAAFGSHDALLEKLSAAAVGHFASGWAWLVAKGDAVEIVETHDAATPITSDVKPLLTIDVWEHAYYIDQRNNRAAYVKAVTGSLLNWDFASRNFSGEAWTYPG